MVAAEIAAIVFLCVWLPSYLPLAVAFAAVWLLSLIAAICIYLHSDAPEINCSLILMICALPVIGAVVCLLSLVRVKGRGTVNVKGASAERGLESALFNLCGTGGADYDKAVYLKSGDEYFNLLFKEIRRAKSRVYLEYFIVRRGKIFDGLISAIRAARANGAEVKFIIDGVGSAFKMSRREVKALRSAGAEVKVFRRIIPLLYTGLNNRDHRKIAAIDGRVAFTGGFNIGDEYANVQSPYGYWKDTGVAVYGEAAKVFEGMFLSLWGPMQRRKQSRCGNAEVEIENAGKARCIPFCDSPHARSGVAEKAFVAAINSAKSRLHIFTPYFCAGERINDSLAVAAMRGVDVRIIIPHVPDKKYAFELSRTCAASLVDSGVKFYEFTPGFMHAKSIICDDKLLIGTYNLDFRSLRLNYECGAVFDGDMCRLAELDFLECMRLSTPLLPPKVTPARAVYRFFLKLFAPLF